VNKSHPSLRTREKTSAEKGGIKPTPDKQTLRKALSLSLEI
jgi:alcohol dehydrogenase YqhD (iron-dependent ADH family)